MGNVIDKGKKSKGLEISIVNSSNKYPVPAFNNAKNLATLQDYPRNNLPQILEAYQYWLQSDGQKTNNLTIFGFEDVFGQLFADPVTHFHQFHNPFISVCPAIEVFNLFILMCNGHMKNKFRLLCEINLESKQHIRVEAIQALLYRMLVSLQLAFSIEIPLKDELNAFVEYSIRQFIERNAVVNQELISHLSNDHHLDDNAMISNATTTLNTNKQHEKYQLSFKEFWQWCQDVSMISNYVEAIQKICSIIANKVEDSRKGSQFLLRNSFFAPSITRRSSNRFDMGSILNKWQRNNLTQYSFVDRHVTWTNTFRSLAQTSWLEDVLLLESDQYMFTLLEHILLSPRKNVVIIDRQLVKFGVGGGELSQSQVTSSSQQPRPPGVSASSNASFLASSRNTREAGNGINTKIEENDPISSNFHSALPRSPRAGKQNTRANFGEKVEMLGILDHVSIVTWILQCLPATVFSDLIEIEESIRSRRLSLEFALEKTESKEKKISSLLDSIMKEASDEKQRAEKVSSTEGYDAEDMFSMDGRLVNPRAPAGSTSRRPTTLRMPLEDTLTSDKPFVARVADKPSFHNATIIPWQKIGEKIFHTSAKTVFSNNVFLLYNHKQKKRFVFSGDYPIYNAFLLFAQGHRQIPLANDLQRNYFNVYHTLDVFEMASFLYDNFSTYFPEIDAKRSIYWSGLMRKPNLINYRDTLAVGWMKLLQSRTDSAMIVDEQNKVCGVLTLQDSLKEIWWKWRKRFLVEDNVSFADLEQQYLDGNYPFYDPSLADVKTSSSTFASGMTTGNEVPSFSTGLQTFGNNAATNARLMGGLNLTINTSLISEESTAGGVGGRPASQRNFNLQMAKDLTLFSQLQTPLDRCEHILGLKLLPLEEHVKEVIKPRKTMNSGPRSTRRAAGSTNPASATTSTPVQEGFFSSDLGNLFNSAITSMTTPKTGKSAHKTLGFNELASPAIMEASPRSNSVTTPSTSFFPPTIQLQQLSFKSPMVNWNGFSFDMEDEGQNRRPTPKDDVGKLAGGGGGDNVPATPSMSTKLAQPAVPSLVPPGSSNSPTRATSTDGRRAGSPSSPRKRRQLTKEQQAALQAQQMAERAALRQKLAQIRKKRRTEQWYAMHRVLSPRDTLPTALRLMAEWRVSSVHVVSETGIPLGTVTVEDLCKYIIIEEAKAKFRQQQSLHTHRTKSTSPTYFNLKRKNETK